MPSRYLATFALLSAGALLVVGVAVAVRKLAAEGRAAGLALTIANDPAEARADGSMAPDVSLPSLDGETTISLSGYRGSVVVLNFWATWCAPCVVEMPDLAAAQRAHAVEGLVVLAINQQEGPATVRGFLNRHQLDLLVLLDAHGTVGTRYRVRALPTSLFLDRSGVIRHRFNGALGPRTLSDRLQTILE